MILIDFTASFIIFLSLLLILFLVTAFPIFFLAIKLIFSLLLFLIAIINLNGPILNNFNQYLINNVIDYIQPEKIKRDLENLENLKPKIVIFKINSPGGTVNGTWAIGSFGARFNKRKITKLIKIRVGIEINKRRAM